MIEEKVSAVVGPVGLLGPVPHVVCLRNAAAILVPALVQQDLEKQQRRLFAWGFGIRTESVRTTAVIKKPILNVG